MNKKTKALTTEQYKEIIQTMREGFCGCRPNERIATALVLEVKFASQCVTYRTPFQRVNSTFVSDMADSSHEAWLSCHRNSIAMQQND